MKFAQRSFVADESAHGVRQRRIASLAIPRHQYPRSEYAASDGDAYVGHIEFIRLDERSRVDQSRDSPVTDRETNDQYQAAENTPDGDQLDTLAIAWESATASTAGSRIAIIRAGNRAATGKMSDPARAQTHNRCRMAAVLASRIKALSAPL